MLLVAIRVLLTAAVLLVSGRRVEGSQVEGERRRRGIPGPVTGVPYAPPTQAVARAQVARSGERGEGIGHEGIKGDSETSTAFAYAAFTFSSTCWRPTR